MGDSVSAITTKVCNVCKQVKDLSMFHKSKSNRHGRHPQCKSCRSNTMSEYYERNKEKKSEYYERNKEKILVRQKNYSNTEQVRARLKENYREKAYVLDGLLKGARRRAKIKELPFDLTMEWLETMITSYCPITLQLIDWTREQVVNGNAGPNSPSIDKNMPELGYVQSNCAIVSHRGNMIKSNGTIDEHRRVVQYMAAQQLRDIEF